MEDQNQIRLVFAAGAAQGTVRYIDGRPFLVVPDGWKTEDLESKLPAPTRQRGAAVAHDLGAFLRLWDRFHGEESVVFMDCEHAAFRAVYNYAANGLPSWNDHHAVFKPAPQLDWQAWVRGNGQKMRQLEFAEFIENNLNAIIRPSPAEMLEVATHLVAHRDIKFEAAVRTQTGQVQLRYDETIRGQVKAGLVDVPERFVLGLSPFLNGEEFELEARLRYRIQDGQLMMWYDLHRHVEFFNKALDQLAAHIEAKTGSSVIRGTP